MEAKLSVAEFKCYNKAFSAIVRKEESKDAVVPDTFPDISDVLCTEGRLLIRSKDVSAGRVRVELNLSADVLYKGEDGKIYSLNVNLPLSLNGEQENIGEQSFASVRADIVRLDARALNPRKVLIRTEVDAEITVYESSKFSINKGVENDEHIRSRICGRQASFICAVGEKTFALTDEISLPPAAEAAAGIFLSGCSCTVDDVKAVGTKLIVKGRVKCSLYSISSSAELVGFESASDYSQVVEIGCEAGQGLKNIWIIPSGAYCVRQENENRISLELHLVAQYVCRSNTVLEYIDDAYSNRFELQCEKEEKKLEFIDEPLRIRESVRQLFETAGAVSDIVYSALRTEKPLISPSGMKLPLNFSLICKNGEELWCENRRTELNLRLPEGGKNFCVKSLEILDRSFIPVPGGVEMRLDVSAELYARQEEAIGSICSVSYSEEEPLDNSGKPSLTLLRVSEDDELWSLARNNCSSPEAILEANAIDELASAVGKLILIPKTY